MSKTIFQGVYTPIITPFNADFSINFAQWTDVIEYQIASKVHGIIIGGSTGEYYALSHDERARQFAEAGRIIRGRVPWVAGVNDLSTRTVCDYAALARSCKADGILLASPAYSLPDEVENATHALAVDKAANLPVMLYNYPGRTGVNMGKEYLKRVSVSANIKAIKESSGDLSQADMIAGEFPTIELSCGADNLAADFFIRGATGWVSATANFLPAEAVQLFDAATNTNDMDLMRQRMTALLPIMALLEQGGKFISCVKYACSLRGLCDDTARLPILPADDALKSDIKNMMAATDQKMRALAV